MAYERVAHDPRFRSGPPAVPNKTLPAVPEPLAALLTGVPAEQVWVKRESEVWRVQLGGVPAYLKIMDDLGPFADELARLRWCTDHSPIATPHLLGDALDDLGRGWFVASEVAGTPAHDAALAEHDPHGVVRSIAGGLRRLHDETDPGTCPFALGVDDLIASAEARVAIGGVDPTSMRDPAYQRQTAAQLLDHLIATRPPEPIEDQVVTHGDPCQPNLLLAAAADGLELAGLVDLGRLAVSDRYRDLAIAHRSLDMNLGPDAAAELLATCGPTDVDHDRLTWWTLVDDLW
ncbi:MAG TPA: phosphotransferase [Acidimicrobiales bacterium]|nr:phosphotransferase [Acidimicrobiales bacterium]